MVEASSSSPSSSSFASSRRTRKTKESYEGERGVDENIQRRKLKSAGNLHVEKYTYATIAFGAVFGMSVGLGCGVCRHIFEMNGKSFLGNGTIISGGNTLTELKEGNTFVTPTMTELYNMFNIYTTISSAAMGMLLFYKLVSSTPYAPSVKLYIGRPFFYALQILGNTFGFTHLYYYIVDTNEIVTANVENAANDFRKAPRRAKAYIGKTTKKLGNHLKNEIIKMKKAGINKSMDVFHRYRSKVSDSIEEVNVFAKSYISRNVRSTTRKDFRYSNVKRMTTHSYHSPPPSSSCHRHVVIGGGTAASVLVCRLIEAGHDVVLVEQGLCFPECSNMEAGDWPLARNDPTLSSPSSMYISSTDNSLYGRDIVLPQGEGLGGTSNINAMIWSLGHRQVYDRKWHPSWNSQVVEESLHKVHELLHNISIVKSSGHISSVLKCANQLAAKSSSGSSSSSNSSRMNGKDFSKLAVKQEEKSDDIPNGASNNHEFHASNNLDMGYFDDGAVKEQYYATLRGDFRVQVGDLIANCIEKKKGRGTLYVIQNTTVCSIDLNSVDRIVRDVKINVSNIKVEDIYASDAECRQLLIDHIFRQCTQDEERENSDHNGKASIGNDNSQVSSDSISISTLGSGEVICCAGVFGTPKILYNSLSQPKTTCSSSVNIGNLDNQDASLRNVIGQNLQDHTILPIIFAGNWNSSNLKLRVYDREDELCIHPTAEPSNGVHGWINLNEIGSFCGNSGVEDDGEDISSSNDIFGSIPRLQLLAVDGRIAVGLLPELLIPRFSCFVYYNETIRPVIVNFLIFVLSFKVTQWLVSQTFGFLICDVNPRSRGKLEIEKDEFNVHLQHDLKQKDILLRKKAVELIRRMLQRTKSSKTSKFWCYEVFPGPLFVYLENSMLLSLFVRLFTTSYYHMCGTCKMQSREENNDDAVVDHDLKVLGYENLRICDASVIPHIPTGPTAAVCMAMGQRLADMLIKKSLCDDEERQKEVDLKVTQTCRQGEQFPKGEELGNDCFTEELDKIQNAASRDWSDVSNAIHAEAKEERAI